MVTLHPVNIHLMEISTNHYTFLKLKVERY